MHRGGGGGEGGGGVIRALHDAFPINRAVKMSSQFKVISIRTVLYNNIDFGDGQHLQRHISSGC